MSSVGFKDIRREFLKSKMGIAGALILAGLITVSISSIILIPLETFQQWNNPENWISYPKAATPIWINYITPYRIPEHQIIQDYQTGTTTHDTIHGTTHLTSQRYTIDYTFDGFPNDFIYEFTANYVGTPLVQITIVRPDDIQLTILTSSIPYSSEYTKHQTRIFSTDHHIVKNLRLATDIFEFDTSQLSSENIIFSQRDANVPLKGQYVFIVDMYAQNEITLSDSRLLIGGKAFGVMGTDELRRDLAIGLLWGTPLALFIGLVVAIASVVMGLIYGVYAGYRGRKTDEVMMRFNDVIYALPALPFLIILSITISNSIFVMIGFLMIFGWVGVAKVSRSMSLQIKTSGYIDAAKIMGQRDRKIIFRHILPQLLPYAFASIAISVPAAITTEAGLSFLGLGDPSFPTWGQILHDADTFGAASRGLWWWIVPPGMMIAIAGLGFVFIGNALDKIVNPKLAR